jgi:hypothetical protein
MKFSDKYLDELRSVKEVAYELGRHENYVYAMKGRGLEFISGRTTMRAVFQWQSRNPAPFSNSWQERGKKGNQVEA